MPGQEIVVPRAQDEPGEGDPRRFWWLVTRSDRPIVPGSVALFTALAFVLVRWQTWAEGDITRFILVGRHFATPSQLPPGVAVAPTYGYDGQFFYRLALNPVNFSHIAYGIRVDQPYRYMRIGYPWLTWLVSFGQHVLAPVILVVINIVAIGAIGHLGGLFARQGGGTRWPGWSCRPTSACSPACPGTRPSPLPPHACSAGCWPSGRADHCSLAWRWPTAR
jgi:hypothetical protein